MNHISLKPDEVRRALRNAHALHGTWAKVSQIVNVNPTTCSRIATSNYLPKDKEILTRLCLSKLPRHNDLLAFDTNDLLWMLENREEF